LPGLLQRGPELLSVCRRDAADHAELAARADRRLGATIEEY
jgi:hypothetical protein